MNPVYINDSTRDWTIAERYMLPIVEYKTRDYFLDSITSPRELHFVVGHMLWATHGIT